MQTDPPWSVWVQLTAVIWWQSRSSVHPIRCPNHSAHPPLAPFYDGERARLCCLECEYQQETIPEPVTRAFIEHHLEEIGRRHTR
jgi:hypothetical protein